MPITEQEREKLAFRAGKVPKREQKKFIQAAAAGLVIKAASVTELRLLVENTAAQFGYNPIKSLIEIGESASCDLKDRIAIHKALLPFLVPQLATPKPDSGDGKAAGVKVTITQFVFPKKDSNAAAIHTVKPAMVSTEPTPA